MSDSIFSEGNDQTPQTPEPNADQQASNQRSYEELVKSKEHADQFIETLKGELKELRGELATRARLEEVLDQLTSRNNLGHDDNDGDDPPPDSRSHQPAINTTDIEKLIEQKVTQQERDRTARENRNTAITKLKEVYGQEYVKRLEEVREELGLDKETLNDLAARSPKAFLELVTPKNSGQQRPFVPPASQTRTEGMNQTHANAAPGSAEYYANLKKNNPSLYRSPQVQAQLHKDAIRAAKEGRPFDTSVI